jgi:hypothetical protein
MIYQLKTARKAKDDGYIHHEVAGEPDKIYLTLRAGLSWPENMAPAYFCILGQKHRQNELKRYPLIFLAEGQGKDLAPVLDKLTDLGKRIRCEEIRADLTEDKKLFRDFFHDYCIENEVRGHYLRRAPWPDQFAYGLGIVRDWLEKKSLEIQKDSILAQQLGRIPEDIKAYTSHPEEDFFAVSALRYVLASFQKHPHQPDTMKDIDYGDPENYPGYYPGIPI